MKKVSSLAGLGGVSFTVLFMAATIISNPPGGTSKASNVTAYITKGHRPAVIIALPFFAVLLWLLVVGVWSLVSDRVTAPAAQPA